MYFDGRFKLNVYHDIGSGELFDLHKDPDEFHDRWNDEQYSDLKADLIFKNMNSMMCASGAGPKRTHVF